MGSCTRAARAWKRTLLFAIGAMLVIAAPAGAAKPVTFGGGNALMTTINYAFDSGNHCQNGPPAATVVVNCNIYDGKQHVWFNGGPTSTSGFSHGDGKYFFVVLEPGGKSGSEHPYNDAGVLGDENLSDDFDTYQNRTFNVVNGEIVSTDGTHTLALDPYVNQNKLRLLPYSTTTNPGGVYQLAVCWLGNGYPITNTSDCAKSDNFKTGADDTGPECPEPIFSKKDGYNIATQMFRDTGGLEKVEILSMTNVNFTLPPAGFTPAFYTGATDWVTLVATQIDPGLLTQAEILAYDVGGNATKCDPVMTTLKVRRGAVVTQRFRVNKNEGKVRIRNGRPGLSKVRVSVNGRHFTVRLAAGQKRTLKIGKALTRERNRIVLRGYGARGARASLTVAH